MLAPLATALVAIAGAAITFRAALAFAVRPMFGERVAVIALAGASAPGRR